MNEQSMCLIVRTKMSHVTTCSLYQPVRAMGREDVSLQSIAHKNINYYIPEGRK